VRILLIGIAVLAIAAYIIPFNSMFTAYGSVAGEAVKKAHDAADNAKKKSGNSADSNGNNGHGKKKSEAVRNSDPSGSSNGNNGNGKKKSEAVRNSDPSGSSNSGSNGRHSGSSSGGIGNAKSTTVQAADNSQTVATGAGSDHNRFINRPTNVQVQESNTGGGVIVGGGDDNGGSSGRHSGSSSSGGIGNAESTTIQAADNSQTVATGAGSDNNVFVNRPSNFQAQESNTGGGVIVGGDYHGSSSGGGIGNAKSTTIQAADNSQTVATGAGSDNNRFINVPFNFQVQQSNTGGAVIAGGWTGFGGTSSGGIGNAQSTSIQFADNSQTVATGAGSDNNVFVNRPVNYQGQTTNTGGAVLIK
jgi:hypothetical protein